MQCLVRQRVRRGAGNTVCPLWRQGLTAVILPCRSMITKNFVKNPTACRELFFSEDLPPADLEKYQTLLRENASPVPVIDVSHPLYLHHLLCPHVSAPCISAMPNCNRKIIQPHLQPF